MIDNVLTTDDLFQEKLREWVCQYIEKSYDETYHHHHHHFGHDRSPKTATEELILYQKVSTHDVYISSCLRNISLSKERLLVGTKLSINVWLTDSKCVCVQLSARWAPCNPGGWLTCAGPPCCWWSGSEQAHRPNHRNGMPPHRTGPLEIRAAGGSWEEARQGEPSHWAPSQGLWNWAGAQTEALLSCCHQQTPVWRGWLTWREAQGHRSPGGERHGNISLCNHIIVVDCWRNTYSKTVSFIM